MSSKTFDPDRCGGESPWGIKNDGTQKGGRITRMAQKGRKATISGAREKKGKNIGEKNTITVAADGAS